MTPSLGADMDLPELTRENQWNCRWCNRRYVVPIMARDCEDEHEELTEEEEFSDVG